MVLTPTIFWDPLNRGRKIINIEIVSIKRSALLQSEVWRMLAIFCLTRLVPQLVSSTIQTTVRWRRMITFTDRFPDPSSTCAGAITPTNKSPYLVSQYNANLTSATVPTHHPQPSSPHYSSAHILTSCTTCPLHTPYHLPMACAESYTHAVLPWGWSTTISCMAACTNRWKIPVQTQTHIARFHQRTLRHILILFSFPFQGILYLMAASSRTQIRCWNRLFHLCSEIFIFDLLYELCDVVPTTFWPLPRVWIVV